MTGVPAAAESITAWWSMVPLFSIKVAEGASFCFSVSIMWLSEEWGASAADGVRMKVC